jgi:hypothetical protein
VRKARSPKGRGNPAPLPGGGASPPRDDLSGGVRGRAKAGRLQADHRRGSFYKKRFGHSSWSFGLGEGANLEEFHPGLDGGGFRAEFKIPPKSPFFGVIVMLRPEKGQRTFINAAAKVLRSEWFPMRDSSSSEGAKDLTSTSCMKRSAESSRKAPPPSLSRVTEDGDSRRPSGTMVTASFR